jgi:hypothetical protein
LLAYEGEEDAQDEEFLEGTVPTETASPAPDGGAPSATHAIDSEALIATSPGASSADAGASAEFQPNTANTPGANRGDPDAGAAPEPPPF